MFRSNRSGMVSWFLEESEQERKVCLLEQFLETTIRFKHEEQSAELDSHEKNTYLVKELHGYRKSHE